MTPEHWRRVREILEAALEADEEARGELVAASCGGDRALRRDVESLLALDRQADDFLERPAFDLHSPAAEPSYGAGDRIGRFRLIRLLGSGGMARVYLAERADDEFEQRVALKLIRRERASPQLVERFRRERQILADLEHRSIARLLDGGTTGDGQPYLVAEYVEGRPIDRYCRDEDLSVPERLALFQRVCEAVDAAHRQLVVHRDLKPDNILVDAEGDPKLLDFGIAKILGPEGIDPAATQAWHRYATPEAASPEQLAGGAVTTATDVYSLGVLLYRLLADRPPFDLGDLAQPEIERTVAEREAPPPSRVAPAERRRELAGDLDAIVAKALRKEPESRYRSAAELSDDIERHLEGRPVAAVGDAFSYRMRKLGRRYRLPLAVAAAVLLAILASAAVAWSQRARAIVERERAERVSGFVTEMLTLPDPSRSRGESFTVREALDAGRTRILVGLEDEPLLRAELMDTIGGVYRGLGLYPEAAELFAPSLALREEILGPDDPLVAQSLHHLAEVRQLAGEREGVEPLLRRAIAIQRRHAAPDDPELLRGLNNLATYLERTGDLAEAEALHREVLAGKERLLGPSHPETARTRQNLAVVLHGQRRHAEAEPLFRRALADRRQHHGELSPEVVRTLNGLASTLEALGDNLQAEALHRQALAGRRALFPAGHPDIAVSLNNLANLLAARGERAEAESFYREALALQDRLLPPGHPQRAIVQKNLAKLLLDAGDAAAAEPTAREAVAGLRTALAADHWRVAEAESIWGGCLAALGRHEEAAPLVVGSYSVLREARGLDAPETREALERAVALFTARGDLETAERYRSLAGGRAG